MPRPTTAQLRQLLDDLGLDIVDPTQFFSSTSPELIRLLIDGGPLKPLPSFNFLQTNLFTTGAVAASAFDITGANPNEIRVIQNMTVEVLTANIDEIEFQWFDGAQTIRIWRDVPGAPFAIGPYIGADNTATQAWGAQGLNHIVAFPQELTQNPNNLRQLQIRLISAAAVAKSVRLHLNVTQFDSRLFNGGQW